MVDDTGSAPIDPAVETLPPSETEEPSDQSPNSSRNATDATEASVASDLGASEVEVEPVIGEDSLIEPAIEPEDSEEETTP